MFYSPLRYPGGKNRLAKFVSGTCRENDIGGYYVEPYAGGASVALYLLFEGVVKKITINDYDRSIYAFWNSVLKQTKELCELIKNTEINIENWRSMKSIQKDKENADLLSLGFSTFFLNRANRSGIINAGVIGGLKQEGNYKMDCRFNKEVLIEKIQRIANRKKQISLSNKDALCLLKKLSERNKNTMLYLDPPYYMKGATLYMNHYSDNQHLQIANVMKEMKNTHWMISYDNEVPIRKMYNWACSQEYSLKHHAYKVKEGKEVLFYSQSLKIPSLTVGQ